MPNDNMLEDELDDESVCVGCACAQCELRGDCFYHQCNTDEDCRSGCYTDYCIKQDEEGGDNNFLGYDVDDPDDLEDCYEDLWEDD